MDLVSEGHLEVQGLESGLLMALYKMYRAKLTGWPMSFIYLFILLTTLPRGALISLVPVCKGCLLGLQYICCLGCFFTIILGIPCASFLRGSQFQSLMPVCLLVDSNFGRIHLLVVSRG